MDNDTIKAGFRQLNQLANIEYRQSLSQIVGDRDKSKVAERLGRLVGVLIKEPFANVQELPAPSYRTSAFRSWELKSVADFDEVAATNPWQYQLLEQLRQELDPSTTVYFFAQDAHHESGFFGLYARTLRKYICGDKKIRKQVSDAFKAYTKMGGSMKAPTPEGLVGAGGLALGAYLVQAVPALGMAGAPVVAAVVLIIYVLGVNAFCEWSNELRTDESEKH
jgi:hypothetical protein